MTTRDKLAFVHAMARRTSATVRQCEALMRYAGTLTRLRDEGWNKPDTDGTRMHKRQRIRRRIWSVLDAIGGDANHLSETAIQAVFDNNPRGAVLVIRVPDGGEVEVPS